jgi:hypothetical protein
MAGQAPARSGNYLVASPQRYNPPGVGDSQLELPRLLGEAKHEVRATAGLRAAVLRTG